MSGTELLEQVKEVSPNTVRLLLTSYANIGAVVDLVNTGDIFRFVEKPWNNEQIKKNHRSGGREVIRTGWQNAGYRLSTSWPVSGQ
jgi:response regulator RpfG family c-di-GMP phosphodiesterase